MEPTTKLDDVWEQIAALRASYEDTIERADAMIAEANELKREARKGLDALPVAKTRRTKREKTTNLFDKVEWPSGDAGLEDVRGKP